MVLVNATIKTPRGKAGNGTVVHSILVRTKLGRPTHRISWKKGVPHIQTHFTCGQLSRNTKLLPADTELTCKGCRDPWMGGARFARARRTSR